MIKDLKENPFSKEGLENINKTLQEFYGSFLVKIRGSKKNSQKIRLKFIFMV